MQRGAAGEVVLTDVDGKETRLAGAKLTAGTRRLGWLADPKGATPVRGAATERSRP